MDLDAREKLLNLITPSLQLKAKHALAYQTANHALAYQTNRYVAFPLIGRDRHSQLLSHVAKLGSRSPWLILDMGKSIKGKQMLLMTIRIHWTLKPDGHFRIITNPSGAQCIV